MRLFVVVPLVGLALGAPASAQTPARGDANAALKYWTAFGLLPALDKDQEKIVQEWDKVPIDAAARKVIDQSNSSLLYLHRGAAIPRCDWSPNYEDGMHLLLPHLAKARTLANLAALRARSEFKQGNHKAGMEDVVALLRLARHVQTDPIMINQLVGYVIQDVAIRAAAPHLPAVKAALADVATALDRLPPSPTVARMLDQEREHFLGWIVREMKAAEKAKPGGWKDVWAEVTGEMVREGGAAGTAAKAVGSAEEAIKLIEGATPVYAELGKLSERPWKEFDAGFAELLKKVQAEKPVIGALLPSADRVAAAKRRADARLAMFKAAVAVVLGGPDKVKEHKDPFGAGPFGYKEVNGGFELKSELIFKGEPVTLVVGKR